MLCSIVVHNAPTPTNHKRYAIRRRPLCVVYVFCIQGLPTAPWKENYEMGRTAAKINIKACFAYMVEPTDEKAETMASALRSWTGAYLTEQGGCTLWMTLNANTNTRIHAHIHRIEISDEVLNTLFLALYPTDTTPQEVRSITVYGRSRKVAVFSI